MNFENAFGTLGRFFDLFFYWVSTLHIGLKILLLIVTLYTTLFIIKILSHRMK